MSDLKIPVPDMWDRHVSNRDADGWPRHRARARNVKARRNNKRPAAQVTE